MEGNTRINGPLQVINALTVGGFLPGESAQFMEGWDIFTDQGRFSISESGVQERITIVDGGNVGIGTNNPQARLDVSDDARINEITVGKGGGNNFTNTAMGIDALKQNNTGENNTAIGLSALANNQSNSNTAVGRQALASNTTGDGNTGLGDEAMRSMTTGGLNTVVGSQALVNNTTGSANVVMGVDAGFNNTNGSGNIFLGTGAGADEMGSDKLYIENSGSSTPLIYGDFATDELTVNGSLNVNQAYTLPTSDGSFHQVMTTDGSGNAFWKTLVDDVNDADNDPTNELQDWNSLPGIPADFADNIDNVEDADSDPFNESNIEANLFGTELHILDNGGIVVAELAPLKDNMGDHSATQILRMNNQPISNDGDFEGIFIDNNGHVGINTGADNTYSLNVNGDALISGVFVGTGNVQGNTRVGLNTLPVATGFTNSAFGENALQSTTSGFDNTGAGVAALAGNTTGSQNSALGVLALEQSNGEGNTALGYAAGTNITTGGANTFIGRFANATSGNLENATAIGHGATVEQSNAVVLGNFADVGIGTGAPTAKLDVRGNVRIDDGSQQPGYVLTTDASGFASWQEINVNDADNDPTNELQDWNSLPGIPSDFTDNVDNVEDADSDPFNESNIEANLFGTELHILDNGGIVVAELAPLKDNMGDHSATQILSMNGQPISNDGDFEGIFINNDGHVGINTAADNTYSLSVNGDARIHELTIGRGGSENPTNTAIGVGALQSNTSGNRNVAVGQSALMQNTEGEWNTAVGNNAMESNTTGWGNTVVGRDALNKNTTGSINVAVGRGSLNENTTGGQNTAVGDVSLFNNTTGYLNVALGSQSMRDNTTGFRNAAVGSNVMFHNTTGGENVAMGDFTMHENTEGSANTAIGEQALYYNTTGSANTAIGNSSMFGNVTGNFNTTLGQYADVLNPDLTNATALGYNAKVSTSNSLVLGATNVNVGIGTDAPSSKLDVKGQVRIEDGTQQAGYVLTSDANGFASWQENTDNVDDADNDPANEYNTGFSLDGNSLSISDNGNTLSVDLTPIAATPEVDPEVGANSVNRIPVWDGNALVEGSIYADNTVVVGNATAFGTGSMATGNLSTAFGAGTQATGEASTSFGVGTVASGIRSTALGRLTTASGGESLATGAFGTASGDYATAMGEGSQATGQASFAVGRNTVAQGFVSTSIGESNIAIGDHSVAMGLNSEANAQNAFAAGENVQANGQNSVAIGTSTNAQATHSTAIGINANADGDYSLAIGTNAQTSGEQAVAIGESIASGDFAVAIGASVASGGSAVALGGANTASGMWSTATGRDNLASGVYSFVGGRISQATGNYAFAYGNTALATGDDAIALGPYSKALGWSTIALGLNAEADVSESVAIGNSSKALNAGAVSIGRFSTASGLNAVTLGRNNVASSDGSVALGYNNTASALFSTATGQGINAANVGELHNSGNVRASGTILTSDKRYKKDIESLDNALSKVLQLEGVSYTYKDEFERFDADKGKTQIGFIAQDVQKVLPELVSDDGTEDAYLGIRYANMSAVLVEAIKEQNEQFQNMQEELDQKNDRIAELESRLDDISRKLDILLGGEEGDQSSVQSEILNAKPWVEQNKPNPFYDVTEINYFIPENIESAMVHFYDVSGRTIKTIPIDARGNGMISLKGGTLSSGTYYYSLIADGVKIDTKKSVYVK